MKLLAGVLPSVVVASAFATSIACASEPLHPPVPRHVLPHERASTWRTVVIPVKAVPMPVPAPRPGIITASVHPPLALAKPLLGPAHALSGIASYYWQDQMTASGERFDRRGMTAAHRTLPLGTKVRVTHIASGRAVLVRINDRGPFKPGRVIDLSEAAAEQLRMTSMGLAHVRLDVVQ